MEPLLPCGDSPARRLSAPPAALQFAYLGWLVFLAGFGCSYWPLTAEEPAADSGDDVDVWLTAEGNCSHTCFGADKWSEIAEPWVNQNADGACCEDLGTNQALSVTAQWVCSGVVWLGCLAWAVGLLGKESFLDRWAPPALVLSGFAVFVGFVSPDFNPYKLAGFLMNIFLLAWSAKYGALVPFLAGAFCGPCFLYPVDMGIGTGLVNYDFNSYAISVGWTTGISNSVTYVLEKNGTISNRCRWLLQSLGWPLLMSGVMISTMLDGSGEASYKLNLCQMLRYFAFQMSLYVFIYYGVCKWVEDYKQELHKNADDLKAQLGVMTEERDAARAERQQLRQKLADEERMHKSAQERYMRLLKDGMGATVTSRPTSDEADAEGLRWAEPR